MIPIYKFPCMVCPDGYKWQEGKLKASSLERVEKASLPRTGNFYEKLTALEPNENTILDFVNKFGFLEQNFQHVKGVVGCHNYREDITTWRDNIHHARVVVQKLKQLETYGTKSKLKQYYKLSFGEGGLTEKLGDQVTINNGKPSVLSVNNLSNGYAEAQITLISKNSDEPIRDAMKAEIALEAHRMFHKHMTVGLLPKQADGSLLSYQPFVIPSSLIGAVWWQIASKLSDDRELRQCEECSKIMDMSKLRADATACSQKCRKRRSRRKKA